LVIQGVIFVVAVLVFRRGVVGELVAFIQRRTAKRGEPAAAMGLAKPAA
jgi:hypothetical protein